jgi:hypothetical protein
MKMSTIQEASGCATTKEIMNTTDKIAVLYIINFMFLDSR